MDTTRSLKFASWIVVPIIFALFILSLPDTTRDSVLITQLPFLAITLFIIFLYFSNQFSERAIKLSILWAALAGLSFAIYLTISWYHGTVPVCSTGGCAKAQGSEYADIFFGIRTATVGIFGYSLVLISLLLPNKIGRLATPFLATFGFAVSIYLTFSSVTVLETTCQWCLGSASAMMTIFILSYLWLIKTFNN